MTERESIGGAANGAGRGLQQKFGETFLLDL